MKNSNFLQFAVFIVASLSSFNMYSQITDTGDKVGIGVLVPQEKLSLPWGQTIGFTHASGAASQIKIKGSGTGMIFTSAYTNVQDSTIKPFQFYTMNHESKPISRVTILNNGNVGIGTRNPTVPLAVKGQINAGSVEVTNIAGWNDSVFLPSYKMRTLSEVENFIKENGHLPEVPSEKEVKQNGFDLAEMDATLLKKIEELTLYVIEQNKKIEALQNEVAKIRKDSAK